LADSLGPELVVTLVVSSADYLVEKWVELMVGWKVEYSAEMKVDLWVDTMAENSVVLLAE
jgi:hypothetical protein